MSNRRQCQVFDLWIEDRIDAQDWLEHIENCPACRAQATLDHDLRRQFAMLPPPHLSPNFHSHLLAKVKSGHSPSRRAAKGWMYGYWLAAGSVSFELLARIEAASAIWSGLSLLAIAALTAGLARSVGVDLMALIWWTTEAQSPANTTASG